MDKKVVVIGAGFAGLSAAIDLGKAGFKVTILEKNNWPGGRAQVFKKDGFRFDMGPSWYLLPDQFEAFFAKHNKNINDYYTAVKLGPSYKIFEEGGISYEVPNNVEDATVFFEKLEAGSGQKFTNYINKAKKKYEFAVKHFLYRQYDNIFDLINLKSFKALPFLDLFCSLEDLIYSNFKHPVLRKILAYPAVFLGGFPNRIPAVYSLLNWVDFGLGAWYPDGGFESIAKAFEKLAKEYGIEILYNSEVGKIVVENKKAIGVELKNGLLHPADFVVANADYAWVENNLLEPEYRQYSSSYWQERDLASSTLNIYLGLDCEVKNLLHHTFFFDANWDVHGQSIYGKGGNVIFASDNKTFWPKKPLFYTHLPSVTDKTVAPTGCSALFILIPVASGLEDTEEKREYYLEQTLNRIQKFTGQDLTKNILFKKTYCINDYKSDYNAYKGNAFGLGQTLLQTALFRPKNYSTKVKNLVYAGQFTIPGTGTSMAIISGQLAAERILKTLPKSISFKNQNLFLSKFLKSTPSNSTNLPPQTPSVLRTPSSRKDRGISESNDNL